MKNSFRFLLFTAACVLLNTGCGHREQPRQLLNTTTGEVSIHGDVWADNWFALYIGDKLLIEDSVSPTTERSFNAESFTFKADYPIVLNFVVKDFKQDDSGLEYIGTQKQQLGDGGFIAQFTDGSTGKLLSATDAKWKCMVLHHGPVEEACASLESPVAGQGPCSFNTADEPLGWKSYAFSTDNWQQAKEYTESEVRPKDGYDRVGWNKQAKLIWSDDLKKDNTILFRIVIEKPESQNR
ncbi:MAG: PEBP family protein [Planctomycetota bacterium]|jgi:hypothetical protein